MEKICTSWDVKELVNNGKQLPTSTGAWRISAINSIALLQCTKQEFGILFGLVISYIYIYQLPDFKKKNLCQADYFLKELALGALFGSFLEHHHLDGIKG